MDKVYLVEDSDCEYRVFEDFDDAVVWAINEIQNSDNSSEDKCSMIKELVKSMSERNTDQWGEGFVIDEFLWCWRIDFYKKNKENDE